MTLLPNLEFGFWNGWVLLIGFYVLFGGMLLILPKAVVRRLYDRTSLPARFSVRRVAGVVLMLGWIGLVSMTPLTTGRWVFPLGMGLYILGLLGMIVALLNYRDAPPDGPARNGFYRISRHPQQLSLSSAFLGTSLAIGSGVALVIIVFAILAGHWRVLAEEQACLERYGAVYQKYMEQAPRYFLFF